MILRKRYVEDKELYSLKAFDEDFYINKDYKTEVKTKAIDMYSKPIHTSEIVDRKYLGDIINIDGCNEYEWCKQKDEKAYVPFYKIELKEKIEPKAEVKKVDKKESVKKETLPEGFVD